jgi:hypothetical protein
MLDVAAQKPAQTLNPTGAFTPKDAANEPKISANTWVPHDIVLRDAWFPLAHCDGVGTRPVRRAVHSQPYFLWRENGKLIASEFHPTAPGKREATFFTGGTGRYPTIERYGYVWGWYGDPANASPEFMPHIPYLPPEGGLPKYMRGTVRFDCASPVSLENLIDLTHADFLHANVVGDEISDSDRIEYFSTSETVTMIRHCTGKTVAPVMRLFGGVKAKTQEVRAVIHIFVRSHVALVYGRYRPGFDVPLFHPCLPETRDRTRLDFTMNMSNAHSLFKYVMPQAAYLVSRQDNSMTEPQSPRYAVPTERRDLHSRFDGAGQRYRTLMQELAARQAAGDYAYRPDGIIADNREILGIEPGLYPY